MECLQRSKLERHQSVPEPVMLASHKFDSGIHSLRVLESFLQIITKRTPWVKNGTNAGFA